MLSRGPIGKHLIWIDEYRYQQALEGTGELTLIGEDVPRLHGRSTKLCYKSWWAVGEKYRARHRVDPIAHGGRLEFVMVMDGALCCELPTWAQVHHLAYPQCVELPANLPRTWSLPEGVNQARAMAISRYCLSAAIKPGMGDDYEFHLFDFTVLGSRTHVPPQLRQPECLIAPRWQWQFIELFEGSGRISMREGASYEMRANCHAYVPRVTSESLVWTFDSGRVRGVVLYF